MGAYGIGNRIDLRITRLILKNCIKNSFDPSSFINSKYFDLQFPNFLEEGMKISLNPIDKWQDKLEYEKVAKNLNNLFIKNYSKSLNL